MGQGMGCLSVPYNQIYLVPVASQVFKVIRVLLRNESNQGI